MIELAHPWALALVVLPLLMRLLPAYRESRDSVRVPFVITSYSIHYTKLYEINVLIDNVISYWLSVHQVGGTAPFEGATTYLFLGNRLMQLPLGIFAIAVATTAFPALSTLAAKKDFRNNFV